MDDYAKKRWGKLGAGLLVSLVVHFAVLGVLLVNLPLSLPAQPQEETVAVEIVPPPEEAKPATEEPPPEKAEEQPPEPKQQPEAEAAAAPPPPPPPSPSPSPPPESVPTPQERPVEQPAGEAGGEALSLPVLRPVFEFSEKDSGPRKDMSGDASKESVKPDAANDEKGKPDPEAPKPQTADVEPKTEAAGPSGVPLPDDIALPEIDTGTASAERDGAPSPAQPDETSVTIGAADPVDAPVEPSAAPDASASTVAEKAASPAKLEEVKKLYSRNLTNDAAAMTAMRDIPRPDRADQLCVTELREQLRNGSPSYRPELLPSFRLKEGNVLSIDKAAFRANGQWFNLRFRCEINADATRVVSFAFDVGSAIPKSEWKRYGFPDF
ncbi:MULTISPECIES: DUF930 domain-containing protein [Alphaproteobacteria]|uniref:DUF930 domain-containing protein n=2 Tax=Alphaproteobacteria TaxID=28211 RepID=A0A512HEI9_9HYPH|nr:MULTISPECIES: DUF930 domain-containing protein [Alphaproteobacteria]GEO83868.1 hypothetical protein RNA01_08000 [Ciceribacter naphthalenivorans]GLR21254.1 hypothetical protein GCM10007920_10400 [Ciceribacter naphthalenivorans]GLT04110.1 hypothetical protein GCM10007926_10400 [Sphingomonas psychrolutea]